MENRGSSSSSLGEIAPSVSGEREQFCRPAIRLIGRQQDSGVVDQPTQDRNIRDYAGKARFHGLEKRDAKSFVVRWKNKYIGA